MIKLTPILALFYALAVIGLATTEVYAQSDCGNGRTEIFYGKTENKSE